MSIELHLHDRGDAFRADKATISGAAGSGMEWVPDHADLTGMDVILCSTDFGRDQAASRPATGVLTPAKVA